MSAEWIQFIAGIIAGLLGALVAGAASWLWPRLGYRTLESEWALTGSFTTEFEDEDPRTGKRETFTEHLDLRQRGKIVQGTSRMLGFEEWRGWRFNGRIDEHGLGLVGGSYAASNRNDTSFGWFLVRRDRFRAGIFEGAWLGYAPGTNKIQAGRYSWKKTGAIEPDARRFWRR